MDSKGIITYTYARCPYIHLKLLNLPFNWKQATCSWNQTADAAAIENTL